MDQIRFQILIQRPPERRYLRIAVGEHLDLVPSADALSPGIHDIRVIDLGPVVGLGVSES